VTSTSKGERCLPCSHLAIQYRSGGPVLRRSSRRTTLNACPAAARLASDRSGQHGAYYVYVPIYVHHRVVVYIAMPAYAR
jgi:hypothetical protein